MKVPGPEVPADWPAREARHTRAVRALGAPAPDVLDLVQIDGRDAVVFERIDGPSMWELLCADPARGRELGGELGRIHRDILSAGVPLGVGSLVDRLALNLDQVGLFDAAERAAAHERLAVLPQGAALLHGDLHPGNVLMRGDGPVVIDWFDAAIGHPVADVVRSSLLLRPFVPLTERPHTPGASAEMLTALHAGYVRSMGAMLTSTTSDVSLWEAVVAASRLAEGAEIDEAPLLAIWRDHRRGDEPQPGLARWLAG